MVLTCAHTLTPINTHTMLAQDLALLVEDEAHGAADKHGQEIGDVEGVDDGADRAGGGARGFFVRLRREGDGD